MAQKRGSFVSRLIILFIMGIAAYYFYLTYINPPAVDYGTIANKLDQAINQVLVSQGIGTSDIVKNLHEEKKDKNVKWIQTTKEIHLTKVIDLKELGSVLRKIIEDNGVTVVSYDLSEDKNSLSIKAGVKNVILERLFIRLEKAAVSKYRAAIIIDDVGYDRKIVQSLLELNEPLTFAIMPAERYSRQIDEDISKAGQEIILHQPMEPLGYPKVDPGKRAILVKMNRQQIKDMLRKNFTEVAHMVGVNNHMGSRATENEAVMREILNVLKERSFFFVDSRTSTKSLAYKMAKKMGLRAGYNQVFLDNEDNQQYMEKQLDQAAEIARKNGRVIAIGHAERKHILAALRKKLPEYKKLGIEIVPVSQIVE